MIELAPSLAVMIFGVLPTLEFAEAVPTAVGVALAAPEEFVAVVVPTVAVASTGSVGVFVAEQQHAWHGLCDRCECGAKCIKRAG